MKRILLSMVSFFIVSSGVAADAVWVQHNDLTEAELVESGAVPTSTESVRWPDGLSVLLTYWLGPGDVVYRCAERRDEGSTSASCWRREAIVDAPASADGSRVVRRLSTRRRPVVYSPYYPQLYPHIWIGARR